jgi:hypothetical protein
MLFLPMIGLAIVFASACKNNSEDIQSPLGGTEFKQPVVLTLKFGKEKNRLGKY